jgi:hypothetical protein
LKKVYQSLSATFIPFNAFLLTSLSVSEIRLK